MMLQLFDKQFDLTSRECVFLEIWDFFVSANSHSQSHRLNHDTSLNSQRLMKMLHRFDRVKVVEMLYEIRTRSSISASEQTTVKMLHESSSIINSTSEQTTVEMFYKLEFDHQLNEWANDSRDALHDSALKTERLKNVSSIYLHLFDNSSFSQVRNDFIYNHTSIAN